ncbi:MAG TPA: hypothetical protein VM261_01060 [Kofleriaceae bacterium]|nr:hypothetical protein [Kofleriaceae bacterium]
MGGFCELGTDAAGNDGGGDDDGGPDPDASTDATPTSVACGTLALLRDDFATAGDGPFFEPFMASNVTVTESTGRLVIDLAPGQDGYGGYESFYQYNFLGGGELVTEVVENSADNTILEVRNGLGNKAQLVEQNGQISAALYNVASPGVLATRAWNTSEVFWRIREENGDMLWETSANRQTWNLLHRRALPFDVTHVQGIVAAGGKVSTLSRSSFEQVNPDATGSLFCPSAMLTDDFTTAGFYPAWYMYQNSGCTTTKSGGNLVLAFQVGSTSAFCGMDSSHLWDFSRGNGVAIDANTFPSTANFTSYMTASLPGNNTTRIEFELDGTTLYMRILVNDAPMSPMTLTFNRTTHRWWRLRGDGSSAIWETSTDGSAWTERHRATVPFSLTALDFNIGGGRYGTIAAPLTITLPGINAN